MKFFKYTGPLSGVSLRGHGDVLLIPGAIVKLPGEHEYTARLIRKGWLQEIAQQEITLQEPQPETGQNTEQSKKKRRD